MQKTIVFSLGGSLIYRNKKLDISYIKKLDKFLSKLTKKFAVIVVVGGGILAREFIAKAEKFTDNKFFLDMLGIEATKINALLLSSVIRDAIYVENPLAIDAAKKAIYISNGLVPGISTDGVAALIAEKLNALFINLTNVDGLYSADPKKDKSAKLIAKINVVELRKFVGNAFMPGQHFIMDSFALNIIERSKLKCIILNGKKFKEISKALNNKKFRGTIVE